jgi:hypothetical protein
MLNIIDQYNLKNTLSKIMQKLELVPFEGIAIICIIDSVCSSLTLAIIEIMRKFS